MPASSGSATVPGPAVERLRRVGVRVDAGHSRAVASLPSNAALDAGQPSGASWLDRLKCGQLSLAVAGRRDARRAAAMIGWVLTRSGCDPSVLLGDGARPRGGPHFAVEAIDAGNPVLPTAPQMAVIMHPGDQPGAGGGTSLEALRRLAASVPRDGRILVAGPGGWADELLGSAHSGVEWIALERQADWWGADLREHRGRFRFRVFHRGRFVLETRLQVPGRRPVLGALAAVAVCDGLGVPAPEIREALEEFEGSARDFELRGSFRGVTLVDDAGEDAASVAEALGLCRRIFGPRRLRIVYHPPARRLDATEADRHGCALAAADDVLLLDPFPQALLSGGLTEIERIAEHLEASGIEARRITGLDEAIRELDRRLEPGDVLVTLGAGDVGTIADAFIRRLPGDRQSR